MADINDGGPAFPVSESALLRNLQGMSLRDHFAGLVLGSLLAGPPKTMYGSWDDLASDAYEIADAMLKAREVRNG